MKKQNEFFKENYRIIILKSLLILITLCLTYQFRFSSLKTFDSSTCFTNNVEESKYTYLEQKLPLSMTHISTISIYGGEYAETIYLKILNASNSIYDAEITPENSWYTIQIPKNEKIKDQSLTFIFSSVDGSTFSLPNADSISLSNFGNKFIDSSNSSVSLSKSLHFLVSYRLISNLSILSGFLITLFIAISFTSFSSNIFRFIKNKKFLIIFGLIILAFVIFTVRYPFFLSENSLYAEDAVFFRQIAEKGFWKAALGPRGDRPGDFQNFLLYLLLYISYQITRFLFNSSIANLPIIIGLLANLFFSVNATLLFMGIRKKFNSYLAIISYIIVLFIPLGGNDGFIFGKILQIGFLCPILSVSLLLLKDDFIISFKNFILDFFTLLAGLTFPVVYGIIGFYLFLQATNVLSKKINLKFYIKKNFILLLTLIYGVLQFPKFFQATENLFDLYYVPENLVKLSLWRTFLYPILSNFYEFLNDKTIIICFVVFILLIAISVAIKLYNKKMTNSYIFLLGSTFIYALATIIMRKTFTSLMGGYSFSFLDWYFYGNNILTFLLFFISIYDISTFFLPRIFGSSQLDISKNILKVTGSMLLLFLLIHNFTFTKYQPVINTEENGSFRNGITASLSEEILVSSNNYFFVSTYPYPGGGGYFPKKDLLATLEQY